MNPTFARFADVQSLQRQGFEARVRRAVAQVEAARELLEQAETNGHKTAFWEAALVWAEGEEAKARHAFANWQKRDHGEARAAFDFAVALAARSRVHQQALEKSSNSEACANGRYVRRA